LATDYPTPQDVEDDFYEAFETHDLERMMGVWAVTDDVACVQPMGPVLLGAEQIRRSWNQLFKHPDRPDIKVYHRQWIETDDMAVHVVEESITVSGMTEEAPPLIATNVYRRYPGGWLMVFHQVSPPPPSGPFVPA
jgi:uncharacterized protein (TIGR02246 family)